MKFPASLMTICQSAFAFCESLKSARFSEGLKALGTNQYTKNGGFWAGVFYASALECVELPSTLKRIEYGAFE